MAVIGGEDEDHLDVRMVDYFLRRGGLVRHEELGCAVVNRLGRQVADGFDLEEMREQQQTGAVAHLEDLLEQFVSPCRSLEIQMSAKVNSSRLTPAPMIPTPNLLGEDILILFLFLSVLLFKLFYSLFNGVVKK